MPTPDDAMLSPIEHESSTSRATCPPDEARIATTHELNQPPGFNANNNVESSIDVPMQLPTPPPQDSPAHAPPSPETHIKPASARIEAPNRDTPTPMTAIDDGTEEQRTSQVLPLAASAPGSAPLLASHLASPFPAHRVRIPYILILHKFESADAACSFYPTVHPPFSAPAAGSKEVRLPIASSTKWKSRSNMLICASHSCADTCASKVCETCATEHESEDVNTAAGLTEDHPSLTTYFEGEIIGSKYTFITQHPEWGSNEKVDRQHWARFPAYKPLSKYSSRPELVTKDWMQKEHLFMRWKEYFLVPDHRVRTISGASFEGFYYISFNQVSGGIEGIYFHAKSEK
jgi:hypothetical protein